jgi:diguanylate cyclase (GGDEF)-like protein
MRRTIVEPGVPPRLLRFALATIVVGLPLAAGAAFVAASSPPRPADAVGLLVFFGLALLAEMRPVPIDVSGGRLVSLAFVFVVAAQVLFGWQWSVLIGAAAIFAAQLPLRVTPLKLCFNSMVYSIAAGLASLAPMLAGPELGRTSYVRLSAVVFASGAVFVLVNVTLVCTAIALASGEPIRGVLREHLRHSGPVFSIMVFIVAQAVIFWRLSPFLLILVGAPLFTLNLYQRSAVRGRMAQQEAETDSLTGLKNYRAYEAEIADVLAQAGEERATVSLCLLDVDRFKQVNDRHGHPVGDAVLKLLGGLVEELAPRRGYRLGGDEFAVVVFSSAWGAAQLSATLQERFAAMQEGLLPERVTLSTGIATAPDHADDPEGLKKRADLALYQSKHTGKDRSMIYDPASESAAAAPRRTPEFDDRIVTATRLVKIVDALSEAGLAEPGLLDASKLAAVAGRGHVSEGTHSRSVARLVQSLGRSLGVDARELEQLRLAGLLHDVGKIAIPDRILNKPGPLTEAEQQLVRKHPEIGFELVTGLELGPIDLWILHHHEHWDGSGYPLGLAGAEIPFGSRIILVADAFDAMTTHRTYRRAISVEAAMNELQSESGRQFDPLVVGTLAELLANPVPDDVLDDEMSSTGFASLRLGD